MDKVELRVADNYIIDLTTELVSINFNLKDLKDYSQRKTSFSKPISILHTANTAKVFQNAYNLNRVNGYPIKDKVDAELLENGITVLKGYLYLEDITYNRYEVILAANDVDLIQATGDRYINDLVFPAGLHSHSVTKAHILSQWATDAAYNSYEGLKYTWIDYDNFINTITDLNQDYPVMPSVHAYEILNKIVQDNGYTLEIEEPDLLQHIVKIMIPCNRDITEYLGETGYLKSHFYSPAADGTIETVGTKARFYFESGDYDNLEGDTSGVKDYITIPYTGTYRMLLGVWAKGAVEGDEVAISCSLASFEDISLTTTLQGTTQEVDVFLTKGQQLNFRFFYRQGAKAGNQIHQDTFVQLTILDYFYNGQTLEMNQVLPLGYKQKDFINDLFKAFNLYVQVDSFDSKKLYLRTFDKFYDTATVLDWSKKVDINSISFNDLSNDLSKEYVFKHGSDKDLHNEDYLDKLGTGLNSSMVLNDSYFSKGTTTIETSFPATAVKSVTGGTIFLPAILNKKGSREHKARLLFLNKFPVSTVFNGAGFTNNLYTCTPYRNTDLTVNGLYLGFNNDLGYMKVTGEISNFYRTNSTLYNIYYRHELESNLYGGYKILRANFLLNLLDVRPENFRHLIYIYDNKIGGAYFRINSITNYRKGQLSSVELTQVNKEYNSTNYASNTNQTLLILNQSKLDEL